jgi:sensor histidine kinase YesM
MKIQKQDQKTAITIEDNGIGLAESKKIKTKNQKLHESLGLKNVQERIHLLNDIYKTNIGFTINEKPQGGVIVQLQW